MTTFLAYLWRLLVIIIGYFVALYAASLVFLAFVLGDDLSTELTGPDGPLKLLLFAVIIGATVGMITVLPFAIAAILAEWLRWRGIVLHLAVGAAIGAGAMWIWQLSRDAIPATDLAAAIAAGAAGAVIYWWIAGRRAGLLLDRMAEARRLNSPEPTES